MRANNPAVLQLSVVIPALNESDTLAEILAALRRQVGVTFEIIVGDGGSMDDTTIRAAAAGATVVVAGRGRAVQMNAAARRAAGTYLLFLHADSGLDDVGLLQQAIHFLEEAIRRVHAGEITDAKTVVGLLLVADR